jgi:hypothetical protein
MLNAQLSSLPFRRVSVPTLTSVGALVGPAVVLLGMSQGSGELGLLPKLHAEHGLSYTWVIFYGSLFQLPILAEAMKTTVLTGENPPVLLARLNRGAAFACLLLALFAMIGATGFILTVGETVWRLLHWPGVNDQAITAKKIWAFVIALLFASPILFGRMQLQRYMEYVVGTCSAVSLLLFAGAFAVRPDLLSHVPGFLASLLVSSNLMQNFHLPPADLSVVAVGFTYMGLGGWYCLFYPLWGKNRGVGMAAASSRPDNSGNIFIAEEGAENQERLRRWTKAVWFSTAAALVVNAATVVLTSLLAYGLLYGANVHIGSNWDIVTEQARFFEPTIGALAPTVFMIAVSAFFIDAWIGTYGSLAQLATEVIRQVFQAVHLMSEKRTFRVAFASVLLVSLSPLVAALPPALSY